METPIFNAAQAACPGDKGIQKSMLEEVPERVKIDKLPEKQGYLFVKISQVVLDFARDEEKVKRLSQALTDWVEAERFSPEYNRDQD